MDNLKEIQKRTVSPKLRKEIVARKRKWSIHEHLLSTYFAPGIVLACGDTKKGKKK